VLDQRHVGRDKQPCCAFEQEDGRLTAFIQRALPERPHQIRYLVVLQRRRGFAPVSDQRPDRRDAGSRELQVALQIGLLADRPFGRAGIPQPLFPASRLGGGIWKGLRGVEHSATLRLADWPGDR
jgi:hypothetical protein